MHESRITMANGAASDSRRCCAAWWMAALVVSACHFASAAHAQVLEIDDEGTARQVGGGWPAKREAPDMPANPVPAEYQAALQAAAEKYGLSPQLLAAVASAESGFDKNAVSAAGAIGLMQLMPATARSLGVDPRDPAQNLMGGAAYLRAQLDRFDGNLDLALAAYNAGPGRVEQYGGMPPFQETRTYVARNLDKLAAQSLASTAVAALFAPPTGEMP